MFDANVETPIKRKKKNDLTAQKWAPLTHTDARRWTFILLLFPFSLNRSIFIFECLSLSPCIYIHLSIWLFSICPFVHVDLSPFLSMN